MTDQKPVLLRKSLLKHQEEYRKQILAPIYGTVALVVLGIAAAVGFTFLGSADPSNAADISLIWLALVLIVLGVIVFASLIMSIMGMNKVLDVVEKYGGLAQHYVERVNQSARKINRQVTTPLRKIIGWANRFRGEN